MPTSFGVPTSPTIFGDGQVRGTEPFVPKIALILLTIGDLYIGDKYVPPVAVVADAEGNVVQVPNTGDVVDVSAAGQYIERYNYTDANGNVAEEATNVVEVLLADDTQKPNILLTGGKTEYVLGEDIEYPVATVVDDRELNSSEILTKTNYVEGKAGDFYVVYYGPEDMAGNTADPVVFDFSVRLPQQIAAFDLELIGSDRTPFANESIALRVLNANQEELIPATQVTTTSDGKVTVESTAFKSGDALYAEVHFSDSTYAGYPAVARPL